MTIAWIFLFALLFEQGSSLFKQSDFKNKQTKPEQILVYSPPQADLCFELEGYQSSRIQKAVAILLCPSRCNYASRNKAAVGNAVADQLLVNIIP